MQDRLEVAEGKLMRSAVKASLVAGTGSPDSDEVRLHWCVRAKLLSVHSIPDLGPRSHLHDMKQLRRTEVSTQAYICNNLYALNPVILRLSQWEI